MLLGFKRQFAPYVEEGSKTHTIRRQRKIRPRVGETAHCYVDPRQATMRLLGRWPVVKVQHIVIEARIWRPGEPLVIMIDSARLDDLDVELFLFRDGFREPDPASGIWKHPSTRQAFEFWQKQLAEGPFEGDLIHWRFGQ